MVSGVTFCFLLFVAKLASFFSLSPAGCWLARCWAGSLLGCWLAADCWPGGWRSLAGLVYVRREYQSGLPYTEKFSPGGFSWYFAYKIIVFPWTRGRNRHYRTWGSCSYHQTSEIKGSKRETTEIKKFKTVKTVWKCSFLFLKTRGELFPPSTI